MRGWGGSRTKGAATEIDRLGSCLKAAHSQNRDPGSPFHQSLLDSRCLRQL